MGNKPRGPLRRGWTTGACAAAAAKAAYAALLTGEFPDPVEILLPKGDRPSFALARQSLAPGEATAGIIKDAGRRSGCDPWGADPQPGAPPAGRRRGRLPRRRGGGDGDEAGAADSRAASPPSIPRRAR